MTQDTAIGGPQHRFPDTRHSALRGLNEEDQDHRRHSYEIVTAAYWKPVYKYLRLRFNQSNEQAKDLTQSFFASIIEKDTLTRYDPTRAAFRTYLRTCLDSFTLNALKQETRRQRPIEISLTVPDSTDVFHREWVRSVFALALSDLRKASDERGRNLAFSVFEAYDLTDHDSRPSYSDLAARFGLPATTITNYLAAMRRDLRKTVLAKLRELTATDREFQSEARVLLGIDPI